MKKKNVILIIVAVLMSFATCMYGSLVYEKFTRRTEIPTDVREGDVIFHTSKSRQSPLICMGTRSRITHCGVIVMKGGKPYVLETLKTLKLTPLDKFIARADGYWLKRPKQKVSKIKYQKYLGKPYDLGFKPNNNIYYCSELVYDIYKKQFGVELCKMKKVKDYLVLGSNNIPKIKKEMKRRSITLEQEVVAPKDIFYSDELEIVD